MNPLFDSRVRAANVSYMALFDKGMMEEPVWHPQICEEVPSDTAKNIYPWLQGLSDFGRWKGERRYDPESALSYELPNETFDKSIRIPQDAVADDKLGLFNRQFELMGGLARKFPDVFVLECITDYANKTCYDGLSFFHGSHPVDPNKQGGSTYSNLRTTTALTQANYDSGRVAMQQYASEGGRARGLVPDLLIVGADLEFKAKKIVGLPTDAGTSGTDAGNRENVFYNSARLLVIPEWNANGAWILAHTKRLKPFVRQTREAVRMLPPLDANSEHARLHREHLYIAEAREGFGYTHPYLAILNTP